MLDLSKIGHKITQRRKEMKMTQNDLAETLFVTHQAVSKWENGKSIPTIEILFELTKLFNISIDYLLDNSEIDESNYEMKFKNYSRDLVIKNIMRKPDLNQEINNFFYLLNIEERLFVINQLINKKICLEIEYIWPYLNKKERVYLLGNMLSGKCECRIESIKSQLSQQEKRMIMNHTSEYNFTILH